MASWNVLSNLGVRYFLLNLSDALDSTGKALKTNLQLDAGDEIDDVLDTNLGAITKDAKLFKTLNGGGWDLGAPLGQSIGECNMNLVRTGIGNYNPSGTTGYDKLRKWVMDATAAGGATAAKVVIEVVPRGTEANTGESATGEHPIYDTTSYIVVPTAFNPGEKTTDNAQEYSVSFQPYGAPMISNAYSTIASGAAFTKTGLQFVLASAAPSAQPS